MTPSKNSKYTVFWITYLGFFANHMIRTCYAYNKVHVKQTFKLSQFHLGMLDAIFYLAYAFGILMRYDILPINRELKQTFYKDSLLVSVCFSIFAFLSLFIGEQTKYFADFVDQYHWAVRIFVTVNMACFGFWHFSVYQSLLALISTHFDKKGGGLIGFWGTSGYLGNICGYFFSNILDIQLGIKWQTTILIFAIINLVFALLLYFVLHNPTQEETTTDQIHFLKSIGHHQRVQYFVNQTKQSIPLVTQERIEKINREEQQRQNQLQQDYDSLRIRASDFVQFIKQTLLSTTKEYQYIFMAIIMALASYWIFNLWFPIFLNGNGFELVTGYIAMLYDFGAMIGGYSFGSIFSKNQQRILQQENLVNLSTLQRKRLEQKMSSFDKITNFMTKYYLLVIIFCSLICIAIFMKMQNSAVGYSIINFFLGLFIGGLYTVLSVNQMYGFSDKSLIKIEMLSSMNAFVGFTILGLTQFFVSLIIMQFSAQTTEGLGFEQTGNGSHGYFALSVILMMIVAGCFITIYTWTQNKVEDKIIDQTEKAKSNLYIDINHDQIEKNVQRI